MPVSTGRRNEKFSRRRGGFSRRRSGISRLRDTRRRHLGHRNIRRRHIRRPLDPVDGSLGGLNQFQNDPKKGTKT